MSNLATTLESLKSGQNGAAVRRSMGCLEVNPGRDEVNLANGDYRINRMTALNVEQQKVVSLSAIHVLFDATAYQRVLIIGAQTVGSGGAKAATAGIAVLLSALTILIIICAVYAVFRLHKASLGHKDL